MFLNLLDNEESNKKSKIFRRYSFYVFFTRKKTEGKTLFGVGESSCQRWVEPPKFDRKLVSKQINENSAKNQNFENFVFCSGDILVPFRGVSEAKSGQKRF